MREALTAEFDAGVAGAPLRQFVARAAELLLHVGLEAQVAAFFERAPYERRPEGPPGWRNGYGHHTVEDRSRAPGAPPAEGPGDRDALPGAVPGGVAPDDVRPRGAGGVRVRPGPVGSGPRGALRRGLRRALLEERCTRYATSWRSCPCWRSAR